jgi:ATP-binding cassette subfamily B protein
MDTLQKLKLLWPFMRRYRGRYFSGALIVALSVPLVVLNPILMKEGIEILEGGFTPDKLPYLAVLIVGLALLRGFLLFRGRFRIISSARFVERDIRNHVFNHLGRLPTGFYDRNRTGDITSRVINDVEGIRTLAAFGVVIVSNVSIMFIASLIAMSWLSWKLTLVALVPLTLIALVVGRARLPLHRQAKEIQEKLGEISNLAQETFMGVRVVKSFTREEAEVLRFRTDVERYRGMNIRYAVLRGLTDASLSFLMGGSLFVTLLIGGLSILDGSMTLGAFMAFTAYQFMLLWPAMAIGWMILLVQRATACIERLQAYLEEPLEPGIDEEEAVSVGGDIEFRDLSFRYDDESGVILDRISVTIPQGERVAIVGAVGSGKTTLMNVLLRLYPAPDGTVFIGGRDVNTIPPSVLRRSIGIVPQDNFLFSDTIEENLRFGSINGISKAEMVQACDVGGIRAEIEDFPDGFEQLIGERGLSLSGGQKQRLSIARAVARSPSVLILDDAFSSVDAEKEQEILDQLAKIGKGITVILITHRLSSVKDMDRIIVMEEGRIAEVGRHDDLQKAGGTYSSLYDRFVANRELMGM